MTYIYIKSHDDFYTIRNSAWDLQIQVLRTHHIWKNGKNINKGANPKSFFIFKNIFSQMFSFKIPYS